VSDDCRVALDDRLSGHQILVVQRLGAGYGEVMYSGDGVNPIAMAVIVIVVVGVIGYFITKMRNKK
jgi:hypothetical protein